MFLLQLITFSRVIDKETVFQPAGFSLAHKQEDHS